MRLGQVMYAQMPGTGPLALDKAPSSMAVEPAGFNTTHELISAMTYSKAPEFVRMVASIIGKENFVQALFNYHSKFAFSNATSWQWVECMAEFAPPDIKLTEMAKGWLTRTSYPTLVVESEKEVRSGQERNTDEAGCEERSVEAQRILRLLCSSLRSSLRSSLILLDMAQRHEQLLSRLASLVAVAFSSLTPF